MRLVWLRDLRGHDLKKHYYAEYEKLGTTNDMLNALERLRMIPIELIETIESLTK